MLITGVREHVHRCCSVHRVQFVPLSPAASENGFHEGPWSWQQLDGYHLTDREGRGKERGNIGTRHKQKSAAEWKRLYAKERKILYQGKEEGGEKMGRERGGM